MNFWELTKLFVLRKFMQFKVDPVPQLTAVWHGFHMVSQNCKGRIMACC